MTVYAETLRIKGFKVLEQRHHQARDTHGHLQVLHTLGYRQFHLADPVDDLLSKRLQRFVERNGCRLEITDTPMLLTPDSVVSDHFASGRKPFMAKFYEMQRRRLNVLLDAEGDPVGGRWSFDADNRKKLPKGIAVPDEPMATSMTVLNQARQELDQENLPLIGEWELFAYPVDHNSADRWLQDFLDRRFRDFGAYEDAISTQHRVMWHSVLTPMLNCGLLTPQQVLDRTLERAEEGDVPLNSLEGFIRQIIGWREFMAAMYKRHGVEMRNGNFWGFDDRPIPEAFYRGTTSLPPIDDAIHHA